MNPNQLEFLITSINDWLYALQSVISNWRWFIVNWKSITFDCLKNKKLVTEWNYKNGNLSKYRESDR